jgi:hypothetical protein
MLNTYLTPELWNSTPPKRRDLFSLLKEVRNSSPELKNLVHFAIKRDRKEQWRKKDPDLADERYWKHWKAELTQNATVSETPVAPELLADMAAAPRVPWTILLELADAVRGRSLTPNNWHDLANVLLTSLKDSRRWYSVRNWQVLSEGPVGTS